MTEFSPANQNPVTLTESVEKSRSFAFGSRLVETVISAAVFFALWEGAVRLFAIPSYVLPTPSAILATLWQGLLAGAYTKAVAITTGEILGGLAIGAVLGIGLGVMMVILPRFDRLIYPYIVASQTVPKVAIAPLFIVWFGLGVESKVIMVTLTCLFPLLVNTIAGMKASDADRIMLVRALCGSPAQLLWYVRLPSALPYIFAGLHTAVVLAIIGAIVGEFVGARQGIGPMILQANFNLDMAAVFALLVILALLGVVLSALVTIAERKICYWSGRPAR
jgi:NitT/TauT family transport system permease protein